MYSHGVCETYVVSVIVVVMFTGRICHGQQSDMCIEPVCGLSEDQIASALTSSHSLAVRPECLNDNKIDDSSCIKEQYALIECLKKEIYLASEEENAAYRAHTELADEHYNINRNSGRDYIQDVIGANTLLDEMTRDYERVIIDRLCSLDELAKIRAQVDTRSIELAELKTKLLIAIQRETLACNLNKIRKHSVCPESTISKISGNLLNQLSTLNEL